MKSWLTWRGILSAVVGLIPALLLIGVLLLGILLNVDILLIGRSASTMPALISLAGTAAGIVLMVCAAVLIVGMVNSRIRSGLLRFGLLYGANLLMVFIVILLFVRMIGGASMAVVDGVVPQEELRRTSLSASLPLLVLAQVVIVPWVLITLIIMKRVKIDGTSS